MLLNNTAAISRLQTEEGTAARTYAVVYTGVECHIQPLDEQTATLADQRPFKSWLGIFPLETDIKEGDRVRSDGKVYNVSAIEKYTQLSIGHYEVILEEAKG